MKGTVINISYKEKGIEIETNYQDKPIRNWYDVPNKFAVMFNDIKKGDDVDFKYETSNNNKIIIDLVVLKFNQAFVSEKTEYQERETKRTKSIVLQCFAKVSSNLVLVAGSSRSQEEILKSYKEILTAVYEDYTARMDHDA